MEIEIEKVLNAYIQEYMKNQQPGMLNQAEQPLQSEDKQKLPLFISVAEKMKNRAVICSGDLYVHIDGCYTNDSAKIDSEIQKYWPVARYKDLKEVRYQLSIRARKESEPNKDFIAFANGLYSIKDDALTPPTPEIFTINKIPHNLPPLEKIPHETRQKVKKFMMGFADGRHDRKQLLEEIWGLCLAAWPVTRKIFFLIGEGRAVDHDRGKAAADAQHHILIRLAVIEVDGHRHRDLIGQITDHVDEPWQIRMDE